MRRAPAVDPAEPPPAWGRALVLFSGRADLPWLRLLRPGFRHCLVALSVEAPAGGAPAALWLQLNPMAHRTDARLLCLPPGADLAACYRAQGYRVVECLPRRPPRRALGWRPHSCVEVVKRVLGLQAPGVWTPWQLYCHLTGIKSVTLAAVADQDRTSPSPPALAATGVGEPAGVLNHVTPAGV